MERKTHKNKSPKTLAYIFGIFFIIVSIYVVLNKGNLPSILVKETITGGDFTFLGRIVFAIVYPTAILGLTIEGIIPWFFYFSLIIIFEFIYGFLIGWGIQALIRRFR